MLVELADGEPITYRLEQRLRYTYATPVRALRHRLLVVPRAVHGGQRLLDWGITVGGSSASLVARSDRFANLVVELRAARVDVWIEFETWALISRMSDGVTMLTPRSPRDADFLTPTPLTRADAALREAALELSAASSSDLEFAERACAWTHQAMTYEFGVTNVHTDAARALSGGRGVCQDYAHIMLALCRCAGVGARYVSGHLLGEGGSHAWIEVVVTDSPMARRAIAFDPTHNRRVGWDYLTIAIGRDYSDVPPTSGTFDGNCPGVLSVRKRLARAEGDAVPAAAEAAC